MNKVYLGIGGNMDDRWKALDDCTANIEAQIGHIITKSDVYQTRAWGLTNQQDFYNQVICVDTVLDDEQLLKTCQKIEAQMGRVRKTKWGERIIDIDILFFNDAIINKPNCIIPHALLHTRQFVLVPMASISPNFIHPILQKTISELLVDCGDELEVEIIKKK